MMAHNPAINTKVSQRYSLYCLQVLPMLSSALPNLKSDSARSSLHTPFVKEQELMQQTSLHSLLAQISRQNAQDSGSDKLTLEAASQTVEDWANGLQQAIRQRPKGQPVQAPPSSALLRLTGSVSGTGDAATAARTPAASEGKRLAATLVEAASAAASAVAMATAAADRAAHVSPQGNPSEQQRHAEQCADLARSHLFWGCTLLERLGQLQASSPTADGTGQPAPRWLPRAAQVLTALTSAVGRCTIDQEGGLPCFSTPSEQLAADKVWFAYSGGGIHACLHAACLWNWWMAAAQFGEWASKRQHHSNAMYPGRPCA